MTGVGSCSGIWVEVGAGVDVAKGATPAWLWRGVGAETVGWVADSWPPPQAENIRTVKNAIIKKITCRLVMDQF